MNDASARPPSSRSRRDQLVLLATVFACGGAVMVVEILGTRIIGPVFGVSLFVWSALLTVTLASLAGGYYAGGVLADRQPDARLLSAVVGSAGALLGLVPLIRPAVFGATEELGPRMGPLLSAILLFSPGLAVLGMVGPVAVRLTTVRLEDAGHSVGAIYAVSSAGSLIGTLMGSFVLIPMLETDRILSGVAIMLALIGAMGMVRSARWFAFTSLFVASSGLASSEPELPAELALIERVRSPYGLLETISDKSRDVRLLRADHSIIGAQLSEDGSAAFGFLHILEAVRFARPNAKAMLQIGLGIGSLPMALKPFGIESDIVEIDPEVVRMARNHFGFSTTGRVLIEDARTFLKHAERRYDVIVHDTFTGGGTPEHLLSLEVLARIHALLRPNGVLALNFVGHAQGPNAEASFAVMRTLRSIFPVVRAFRDGPSTGAEESASNLIFFASDSDLTFRIPSNAKFENESCAHVLRDFHDWEIFKSVPSGQIITDEHNPLTRLQLPIAEEHFHAMRDLLPPQFWTR